MWFWKRKKKEAEEETREQASFSGSDEAGSDETEELIEDIDVEEEIERFSDDMDLDEEMEDYYQSMNLDDDNDFLEEGEEPGIDPPDDEEEEYDEESEGDEFEEGESEDDESEDDESEDDESEENESEEDEFEDLESAEDVSAAANEDVEESAETDETKELEPVDDLEDLAEADETKELEPVEEVEAAAAPEKKKGWFARLKEGLARTRKTIASGFDSIFSGFSSIDEDFYDELEELMITADMGVHTTDAILENLRERVREERIKEPAACREILIESIREQMDVGENAYDFEDRTSVLLVVGVNGVGKTTSIGKLASQMKARGRKVLLAAADTFRAGAVEQLAEWSRRADVGLISSGEGADPAAVVFDAVSAAKARKTDILIVDTAGRLHNKKNLMEELRKISRVIDREYPEAYRETLAVVDATTGQNALQQAREFMDVSDVSGIILTKMDGTAKGGIAVAIQSELKIPVKYIGVGEQIDDLQKFDADSYVRALFERDDA